MERGNELEPEARQAYQEYAFCEVKEVGFMIRDGAGYSTDGTIDEDGLIEIKCPIAVTHTQYLYDKKVPTKYYQQCQGGLLISGRKYIDFISYNPTFKESKRLFVKRIGRDEDFIGKLKVGIKRVIEIRDELFKGIEGGGDD